MPKYKHLPQLPTVRLDLVVPKPIHEEILRFAAQDHPMMARPNVSATLRDLIWRGLLQRRQEERECSTQP